ncbi:hypothetical protein [Spirosoma sp.]|nr:hypothetical protein [Spirosoma sp.]MBN8821105.1 hypothetical protein [Spirosoma sp.]
MNKAAKLLVELENVRIQIFLSLHQIGDDFDFQNEKGGYVSNTSFV